MNTLFLIELRQRELIRRLCRETMELALRQSEEGMLIPDDELEEESENLYETLRSDLAGMLKPEFLGILAEEHDAVYRSSAGQRLKRILCWEDTSRAECA